MAAAYTALVSLLNTINLEQRPRYHPHHQISIDDGGLIETLKTRVSLLVKYLEVSGKLGVENLEDHLADAAYAAEEAIESYVVDQVQPSGYTSPGFYGSALLCQVLRNVIEDMDFILNEINDALGGSSTSGTVSSTSVVPNSEKSKMVGFEDERKEVMDSLIWDGDRSQKVISIVGMAGSGKTTLVRNIYDDQDIMQHFDFCAWITVSQEYDVKEVFVQVLKVQGGEELVRNPSTETLGERVYQMLFGQRYLIVLDDIWTIDAWDKIKNFFPNDDTESRIMVTTRNSLFATEISTSVVMMKPLGKGKSWNLLCEKVFGPNKTCPSELEDVGKDIILNCRGLPLSIVVIGGLLAKSKDKSHWEHIVELSSSAVHLDEEQHCLNILSLSYNHLPIFLKPCFLYIGVFPEDHVISVSELINLWIAEGLLTSSEGQSLEEIGMIYVQNLIGRNVLTIHNVSSREEIEHCTIHDLLRELCLKEARKEKFLYVVTSRTLSDQASMDRAHRIAILLDRSNMEEEYPDTIFSRLSTSQPRSLIVNNYKVLSIVLGSPIFKLLRVLYVIGGYSMTDAGDRGCLSKYLFNLVNLRHIVCVADRINFMDTLASSVGLLGNLQTLVVRNLKWSEKVPYEIWNLPQLRHVAFDIMSLSGPSFGEQEQQDFVVLNNLQTIKKLLNFRFAEGMLKKISNVKELEIWYTKCDWENNEWSDYCFNNLDRLEKLESFKCTFHPPITGLNDLLQVFPHSLKKLSLSGCSLLWEEMSMIGSLPLLEVLELRNDAFIGSEWNVEEGEFRCLKFLYMRCLNIKIWNADSTHFPCLKRLVLYGLHELEELPLEIGDIATLGLIELDYCLDSLVRSAKCIVEEQQELGNEALLLIVTLGMRSKLQSDDMENKRILIDTNHRDLYAIDAIVTTFRALGKMLPSGEGPDGHELENAGVMLRMFPWRDLEYGPDELAKAGGIFGYMYSNDLTPPDKLEWDGKMSQWVPCRDLKYRPDQLEKKAARKLRSVHQGDLKYDPDEFEKALEDDLDELTVQESNNAESSVSKQDLDPMEAVDQHHSFLQAMYMLMHIATEFRWQASLIAQPRK